MNDAFARLFAAFPFIVGCCLLTAVLSAIALYGGAWLWCRRNNPWVRIGAPVLCTLYAGLALMIIQFIVVELP